jgi:hypothetical protein
VRHSAIENVLGERTMQNPELSCTVSTSSFALIGPQQSLLTSAAVATSLLAHAGEPWHPRDEHQTRQSTSSRRFSNV